MKTSTIFTVIVSFIFILSLAACGADKSAGVEPGSTSAPTAASPAQADQPPTPSAEATETNSQSDPPAVAAQEQPTTVQAAAQRLDLRTFLSADELQAIQSAGEPTVGALNYQTDASVTDVVSLYRTRLTKLGWQELTDQGAEATGYAVSYFNNGTYGLNLSASDMGGQTMVSVNQSGNIDLRHLPQTADAELSLAAPNTLLYFSADSVADVADFTRQGLTDQGWQLYTRPNSAGADVPDRRDMTFKQNGLNLTVAISAAPAQAGKTAVQYSLNLLRQDLPTPAELDNLQLDDSEPYLSYQTDLAPTDLTDFYLTQMTDLGWQEMADSAFDSAEQTTRFFANEADQLALMLNIVPSKSRYNVELRQFDVDELLALRDGGSTDTPPVDSEADMTETDTADSESALNTDSNPSAAVNFPTPDDAEEIEYDADLAELSFTSASDIEALINFYRQTLSADDWQEDKTFSIITEFMGSVDFNRGDESLSITVMGDPLDGNASVTIDLDSAPSLAGSPADSDQSSTTDSAEPLVAEDKDGLPVPDNYTSYSSEGSQFSRTIMVNSPSDVTALSEFFQTELADRGWSLTDSSEEPSSVKLMFEGADGRLTVAIKSSGNESEVTMVNKNAAAATAAGIVPEAGQARIYFGNPDFGDPAAATFTFTLNGQTFEVEPQAEDAEMGNAPYIELPPGEYSYQMSAEGQSPVTDSITVGADEVWGLLAGPFGALPLQMY